MLNWFDFCALEQYILRFIVYSYCNGNSKLTERKKPVPNKKFDDSMLKELLRINLKKCRTGVFLLGTKYNNSLQSFQ